MTSPIPDGYHSVTPYLIVDDAAKAIDFYNKAFGAREKFRLPAGDKVAHAELQIGDSVVMLADEFPDQGHLGPKARGGTTASFLLYVDDVDRAWKQATEAGASETRPLELQFWGDRMGTVTDPFGHQWSLATHVEDVSDEQMQERMKAFGQAQDKPEITIQPELAQ